MIFFDPFMCPVMQMEKVVYITGSGSGNQKRKGKPAFRIEVKKSPDKSVVALKAMILLEMVDYVDDLENMTIQEMETLMDYVNFKSPSTDYTNEIIALLERIIENRKKKLSG